MYDTAREVGSIFFRRPVVEIDADDITSDFEWLKYYRAFSVRDEFDGKLRCAFRPKGRPLIFPPAPKGDENLTACNLLFAAEKIPLAALPPEAAARAIRAFLDASEAAIASRAALLRWEPTLSLWVWPFTEDAANRFRRYCADPERSGRENRWRLRFRCFTDDGGVEAWEVHGVEQRLERAERNVLEPPETFCFPSV
jgi:hypothetical protein